MPNTNLNRRDVLKVIGTFAASPLLLVDSPTESGEVIRVDEGVIPTGFPFIDLSLNGGYRRGLNVVIGSPGSGKTVYARSVGLNAAKKFSVGYFAEDQQYFRRSAELQLVPFEGCMICYPHNPITTFDFFVEKWKKLSEKHDLIIDETLATNYLHMRYAAPIMGKRPGEAAKELNDFLRRLHLVLYENNCVVLCTWPTNRTGNHWVDADKAKPLSAIGISPSGMNYYASTILRMDSKCNRTEFGNFAAKFTKNRWGALHKTFPMQLCQQTMTFKAI